jgi:hypothetical protein
MDTAWIQVFVLTLSECVAPPGKTVCQEQEVQYQFFDRRECESVLQQLVEYSAVAENVIINEQRSRCLPTVKQRQVYASLEEANAHLGESEGWGVLQPQREQQQDQRSVTQTDSAYQQRLASLPDCDAVDRSPPCKVGQIIIESESGEDLEVWKRD